MFKRRRPRNNGNLAEMRKTIRQLKAVASDLATTADTLALEVQRLKQSHKE